MQHARATRVHRGAGREAPALRRLPACARQACAAASSGPRRLPPPHAAPGPGAPRRPREPSAGEGGVPASGERAPTPAPATASCPPGRKGGNRSNITAARPGSGAPAGAAPPLRPRTPGVERPGDSRCGQSRGPEEEEAGRRRSRVWIAGGGGPERAGKRRKTGTGGRTRRPPRGSALGLETAGGAARAPEETWRPPPTLSPPFARNTAPPDWLAPHRAEQPAPTSRRDLGRRCLLRHRRPREPGDPAPLGVEGLVLSFGSHSANSKE
ncbi:basic proline-rich protein-like [Panthera pardus]|uniref:Basic proline-rich protein-like n=1 Tax=Panthera pardus TaxID=9691 RepID=A0A9W2VGY9_PANPR|nr:basic proline-rich protein-like [Panthera pardus]